jgi:hypothetical protein
MTISAGTRVGAYEVLIVENFTKFLPHPSGAPGQEPRGIRPESVAFVN